MHLIWSGSSAWLEYMPVTHGVAGSSPVQTARFPLSRGFFIYFMDYFVELGYLGLFIVSFLTATLVPLSPEVMLGILIAKGFNLELCIVIACMGNWLGGVTTYYVGRIGDWKKIEKFFRIKKEKVYSFKEKIDRWGSVAAFFTWLPLGGDILALALGVFKVDAFKVSLWMLIGKSIRFFVVGVLIYYGIDLFTN